MHTHLQSIATLPLHVIVRILVFVPGRPEFSYGEVIQRLVKLDIACLQRIDDECATSKRCYYCDFSHWNETAHNSCVICLYNTSIVIFRGGFSNSTAVPTMLMLPLRSSTTNFTKPRSICDLEFGWCNTRVAHQNCTAILLPVKANSSFRNL